MKLRDLVELAEPRTKAASLIPFAFGAAYAPWLYGTFEPALLALFLACLLPVDLATTALNNTLDWRRHARATGLPFETGRDIGFRAALSVTVALFALGSACGIFLALETGAVTFLVGAAAVAVAVAYSAGPLPLSRTPLGEAVSGTVMGAGIPFVAIHIQLAGAAGAGDGAPVGPAAMNPAAWPLVGLSLEGAVLTLTADLSGLAGTFLAALPFVLLIANVMLANNLRDMERDRESGRVTLPLAIGRDRALRLFAALQALAFAAIAAGVALRVIPLLSLASFLALPVAWRSVRRFLRAPPGSVPFGLSVANLFVTGGALALAVIFSAAFRLP